MVHRSRTHSLTYRIISIILSIAIVISSISIGTLIATADDKTTATYKTEFLKDGVHTELNKTITDNQNGYFTLKFDATSYVNYQFKPQTYSYTEDGVFTVPRDGYYLVQLWGGAGGDGGNTVTSSGGDGGNSGYVYGCLYLSKNQSLVYTLGTSGLSTTRVDGGGENYGGDKEGSGSYTTGGGGGYSALYFFNTQHSTDITEQERLNDYVMIAGGGGGGGAGNQLLLLSYGNPHGGAGGNITDSLSGHLTVGDNHGIAGTWFGGENGFSSGTSTAYVGRGGTNYVGSRVSSDMKTTPNDWIGTYVAGGEPGSGGVSLMRGGAGGAGFCGGSGGSQTSILWGSNVGGGGGGSSFVADSYKSTYTNENYDNIGKIVWKPSELSESILSLLQDNVNNKYGGRCTISYLGSSITEEAGVDVSPYKNVTATVEISQYFDIISKSTNMGTLTETLVEGADANQSTSTLLTVSDVDISPDAYGDADKKLILTVIVHPKAEFAGGNMVTLFRQQFTTAPAFDAEVTEDTTMSAGENNPTDYVNVPLNIKLITKSYSSSDNTKSYSVESLYEDSYANVRDNFRSMWQYDFINSLGSYTVTNKATGATVSGTVTPSETTTYTVTMEVVLKSYSSSTTMGEVVTYSQRRVSKDAVITILDPDTLVEEDVPGLNNRVIVTAGRTLNYTGNREYNFGIETRQSIPAAQITFDAAGENTTFIVPDGGDGWYYIEALGGGGGGSGSCTLTGAALFGNASSSGGGSSTGGYTGGYVHLQAGDIITFTLGKKGTGSSSVTRSVSETGVYYSLSTKGGAAGENTVVYITREGSTSSVAMVAGGGGGAGGSALVDKYDGLWFSSVRAHGTRGASGAESYAPCGTESAVTSAATNGSSGYASTSSKVVRSGTAGSASENYISDIFCSTGSEVPAFVQANYTTSQRISIAAADGIGAITCIVTDDNLNAVEALSTGFSAEGAITRYFNITDIGMKFEGENITYADTTTDDGYTLRTYSQPAPDGESTVAVANFSFKTVSQTDSQGENYTYYEIKDANLPLRTTSTELLSDPTFVLALTPVDGFVGGNDVPVVKYGVLSTEGVETGTDYGLKVGRNTKKMFITNQDTTDFANVPLTYDFLEENFMVQSEHTLTGVGTVSVDDLLLFNEIPLPSGEDAWLSEFVETAMQITTNPTTMIEGTDITVNQTTVVDFTQVVRPKAEAHKATVVSSLDELTETKKSTVYIQCDVNTNLSHMVYQGPDKVNLNRELSAMLLPEDGYQLEQLTITVGNMVLDNDSVYDAATGRLVIPAESVTDNITITALADPKPYKLTYLYVDPEVNPSEYNENTKLTEYVEEYLAGEAIDYTQWYDGFNANIAQDKWTGYQFVWEWPTEDGTPLETMPGYDYYVIGQYMKKQYTLTINYIKAGEVFDTHTEKVTYGENYSVVSPEMNGYLAEQAVVTGTMGDGNVEINVEYEATPNMLHIISIRSDRNGVSEIARYSQSYDTDADYSVDASTFAGEADVTGYSPDQSTISGTMTADGVTVYVYFTPNSYTVTLNAGEGAALNANGDSTLTRAVQYSNFYSYDPSVDKYVGLPTPYRNGYDFVGWFTAAEGGTQIQEEDIVSVTDDHTVLYAQWTRRAFIVTVYFRDEQGRNLATPHSEEKQTGETYTVEAQEIQDYYSEIDQVSGTVGNSNVVHTIVYYPITYTLTIRAHIYEEKETGAYTTHELRLDTDGALVVDDAGTASTARLPYNQSFAYSNPIPKYMSNNKLKQYHLTSYAVDNGSGIPAGTVQEDLLETLVSGTMGRGDMTIDLYYEIDTTKKYIFAVEFVYGFDESIPVELQGTPIPEKERIAKSYAYGEKIDLEGIEKEIGNFDIDGYASYLSVEWPEIITGASAQYLWKVLIALAGGSYTMTDSNVTFYVVYLPLAKGNTYTMRIHREFYESIPGDLVDNPDGRPTTMVEEDVQDIGGCYEGKFLDFDQLFPKESIDSDTYIPIYLRIELSEEAGGGTEIVLLNDMRYVNNVYLNGAIYQRDGQDTDIPFSLFDPDSGSKLIVMYKKADSYNVTIEFLEFVEEGAEGEGIVTRPMAGKETMTFPYVEGDMLDPTDFAGKVEIDVEGYAAYLSIPGLTGDTLEDGAVPGAFWNILTQLDAQEADITVNSDIGIYFIYVPLTEDIISKLPISYLYSDGVEQSTSGTDEEPNYLVPDDALRGQQAAEPTSKQYYEGQWVSYDELFPDNIRHYMPGGVAMNVTDSEGNTVPVMEETMADLKNMIADMMVSLMKDAGMDVTADYFSNGFIYTSQMFEGMGGIPNITVLYEAREYTARVTYRYSDLVEDVTDPIINTFEVVRRYGSDSVSFAPDLVEGFKPSVNELVVSFKGDITNYQEYVVYYFEADTEITDITIDLGDMIFDFSSAQWDPNEHQYVTPMTATIAGMQVSGIIPAKDESNKITITNNGTTPINALIEYQISSSPYYELMSALTDEAMETPYIGSVDIRELPTGHHQSYYLWLVGHINVKKFIEESGHLTVGRVIVTIGNGGGE